METMKKSTLTIFCILAGCIFVLSGIWIYFQKNLDRVELGEGERATAYQRHYLMIANDKDTGMWQSVYESASKEAESKDAYVELLSPEQMNGYSQADCLKIGIASKVDGIILEADGSKEEQHLINEALKGGIPVVTVMTDDTATGRISFVGLNSYQTGSAYTEQISGIEGRRGSYGVKAAQRADKALCGEAEVEQHQCKDAAQRTAQCKGRAHLVQPFPHLFRRLGRFFLFDRRFLDGCSLRSSRGSTGLFGRLCRRFLLRRLHRSHLVAVVQEHKRQAHAVVIVRRRRAGRGCGRFLVVALAEELHRRGRMGLRRLIFCKHHRGHRHGRLLRR